MQIVRQIKPEPAAAPVRPRLITGVTNVRSIGREIIIFCLSGRSRPANFNGPYKAPRGPAAATGEVGTGNEERGTRERGERDQGTRRDELKTLGAGVKTSWDTEHRQSKTS